MLHKKWIVISLLSTFLWAENNETNNTKESGIFESLSSFFSSENNTSNENNDTNISKRIQESTSKKNTKKRIHTENNETNTTEKTSMFDAISNFFSAGDAESSTSSESNTSNDTNTTKSVQTKSSKTNTKKPIDIDDNESNLSATPKKVPSTKVNSDMENFDGAWHLRVLDGMEVRKARVIFDFTFTDEKAHLSGFDGCNRITGDIQQSSKTSLTIPFIMTTKMACRGKMYRWTSKRVHQLLSENFSIKEEEKHGVEGITVKSIKHELFFKKMQRD